MVDELLPKRGRDWALAALDLERLLLLLDDDRDHAARTYEHLRHRTIGLLRWWGASNGEDLADLTLDRVARKLSEGAEVPRDSVGAYVRGVARMVFYESRRDPHVQADIVALTVLPAVVDDGESQTLASLDRCLAALAEAERQLVLRYYGEGKAKQVRSQLAAELGVSATALRIRAYRLRERLERCVEAGVEAPR